MNKPIFFFSDMVSCLQISSDTNIDSVKEGHEISQQRNLAIDMNAREQEAEAWVKENPSDHDAVSKLLSAAQTTIPGIALGACEDFALMAGTTATCGGALSCEIIGNIGVSPGTSITGNFDAAPIDATRCAAEDGLAALTSGFTKSDNFGKLMDTGEMGGVTFTPGVYKHGTAITIALANPTVYLDALGDGNAVFIFVAGTTLTTCAGSNIVLINGAKANNVFWVLGTAVTMGAGSSLKGTVLAGTAITIGTNGDICGRAIARTAVTCATHCTVGFSDCYTGTDGIVDVSSTGDDGTTSSEVPPEAICLFNSKCGPF